MANKTRTINLHFMVTAEEKAAIERRMAQTGINNLRAYLLKQGIDGAVVRIELDSVKEMVRLLSNATNNLNQIARRVNQGGSVHAAELADVKSRLDEIWAQGKTVLRKLADM